MSNIKSIGQGVMGLRLPKIRGFPLTLNVALTTVLRTNVLHCDYTLSGTEVVHIPKRYRYRTGHRLVPKWTGTEHVFFGTLNAPLQSLLVMTSGPKIAISC